MGSRITAVDLIDRVRDWVADPRAEVWTDASVLARADQVLESIHTRVRLAGRDHDLGIEDFSVSGLTQLGGGNAELALPEYVTAVRQVTMLKSVPAEVPIPQADVHSKDWSRISRGGVAWWRGPDGNIRFSGSLGGTATIRVYFIRRWPPLHYGQAAGGSATTLVFDASPVGRVLRQQSIYVGSSFQLLSGANEGLTVRATAFDRVTKTITFTPAVTAVVATDDYAMTVPVHHEAADYLVLEVARALVTSAGNTDYLSALMPQYAQALALFESSLATRDQAEPRSLWATDR